MKNLTFALACASTFALFAAIDVPKADFEKYTEETGWTVANKFEPGSQDTYWLYDGASGSEDGSTVTAYGGENLAAPTTGDAAGDKYLALSTEGGTLWRSLAAGNTAGTDIAGKLGEAQALPAGGLYIDTMVQFTPTEDGGEPNTVDGDKLAIWLNVDSSGEKPVTNLMVKAAQWDDNGSSTFFKPKTFVLTGAGDISPSTWYRLTVKAIANCDRRTKNENYTSSITGFQIYLDNTLLTTTEPAFADGYLNLATDAGEWGWLDSSVEQEAEVLALMRGRTLIPSLAGDETTATLQAVGFKGSGALDNLAITEQDPLPAPGETIDFTITAGANTTVAWSTDGKTWTDYVVGAQAPAGLLYVRLTNADGATKILTKMLGSGSNSFDFSNETFGWAAYLGEAIDGAYVIDDAAELVRFQKGVATLGSKGVTFKLGASIALTDPWPGIGEAKAKDMVSWALDGANAITREDADARVAAFTADKGGAFQGVFDGDSHTVSNVKFVRGDYVGFFQSCYKSTIKNLKIELAGDGWEASDVTAFGGGGIAGVVVDTTIENCEASGTFTGSKGVGGIVGYAGSGTVLKGCVNKAAVTSTGNEKVGGLIACAQNGNPDMGANGVVVDGCQNLGNLACQVTDKEMVGGLVSYTDCVVTFKGANVVNCTLTQTGDKGVQSVVFLNGGSAIVETGATFTVPAAYKTVNKNAVDGLFYATVADGVATLVKNEAAVAKAELKVMADGAPNVVLANVGDSITLETTLATVTVTTTAENAYVAQAENVYTVTAKADAEFTVSINPTEAEWTAELTLPTPTIEGTEVTGTWKPAEIAEPAVGTTNVYTYTVTVAATDTTKETTKSVEFKVYKKATVVYPEYITDDTTKGKFDTWANTHNITGDDRKTASMDAYLLNCAPADVDTEKAKFKIVSFEQDPKTGAWIVKVTDGNKVDGDDYGNGTIEIQGATTLKGPWAPNTDGAKFFKAILK